MKETKSFLCTPSDKYV